MDLEINLPVGKSGRCWYCDPPGTGKCAKCFGTGQNTQLGSPELKCLLCKGTGICTVCKGKPAPSREIPSREELKEVFHDLAPDWLERVVKRFRRSKR